MHPLTQLACADLTTSDGPIGEISHHLALTLDRLLVRSTELRKNGSAIDLALLGPVLARGTLEVAATALTARVDPVRILAIRKCQKLATYDPGSPNPIRFEWSTDVMGEKGKPWTDRVIAKDIQRGFLSSHLHDLVWQDAFEALLDSLDFHRGLIWIASIKRIVPTDFTAYMRTEAAKLYSELSKGIHSEFVIPIEYQFDKATMSDLFDRVWTWVGNISLTACHSQSLLAPVALPLDLYEEAQRELYS
jgi:hypothetical protein